MNPGAVEGLSGREMGPDRACGSAMQEPFRRTVADIDDAHVDVVRTKHLPIVHRAGHEGPWNGSAHEPGASFVTVCVCRHWRSCRSNA
jgi:hypothetical protein